MRLDEIHTAGKAEFGKVVFSFDPVFISLLDCFRVILACQTADEFECMIYSASLDIL